MDHTLVTPVSPALVLGHVDPSPREVSIRDCGWAPSLIAARLQGKGPRPVVRDDMVQNGRWLINLRQAALWGAGSSDLREQVEKIVMEGEERIEEALEAAGVTVSVSAFNADTSCLVIYIDGQAVADL